MRLALFLLTFCTNRVKVNPEFIWGTVKFPLFTLFSYAPALAVVVAMVVVRYYMSRHSSPPAPT